MHAVSQHWYTDIDHAPKNEFAAEVSLNESVSGTGVHFCTQETTSPHLHSPPQSPAEYCKFIFNSIIPKIMLVFLIPPLIRCNDALLLTSW